MDSEKLVSGIIVAVVVTIASLLLKPLLREIPIADAVFKGAASEAGRGAVEGLMASSPTGRPRDPCTNAADHWKSAEASGQRGAYVDHVERFPQCDFATIAKMRIHEIDSGQARRKVEEEAQRRAGEEIARRQAELKRIEDAVEKERRAALERQRQEAERQAALARPQSSRSPFSQGTVSNAPTVNRGTPPIRSRFGVAIPTCPFGMAYSIEHQQCIPAQSMGGVIPCSQDDQSFIGGRWVSNCR
jgi:hypothetical protein